MRFSKLLMSSSISALLIATPVFAKHETTVTKTSTVTTTKVTAAETGALASIAAIDKNEIIAGAIAVNKKKSSSVTDFAQMMIDQHGSNLTQLLELVGDLHIKSLAGGDAEKIKDQGKKLLMTLGVLKGTDFDIAYVDAMVKGHQAALDLIDQHLMKTATTESVKTFLTDTRAAVALHLEHAKKIQDDLRNP